MHVVCGIDSIRKATYSIENLLPIYTMAQEEEEIINEENTAVNVISELPGRPFSITMEVPLFVTLLALALSGTVVSNVLLFRTCVHALHHTKEECQIFLAPEKSNTTKHLEEEVQKYTTYVTTVKTVIESLVPAVLSLFLGVWSDTYGRKPLVVWPLFGMSISAMMTVVYSLWDDLGPWWLILTVVPFSLTGGYTALFTGAFTYIADITTTANRSFRMLLLELAFASGSFLGALATTYLINALGNVCVLLVVAALYVFAYAFTNICLSESLNGALKGGLCTLLDLLLVKEMMETCFKRRPSHGRAQILLLTISNSLGIFILYGLGGLGYLYAREKLHWAVKEYSVYSAVNTLITAGGAILGLKLGGRALGLGDLSLAIVAYLSAVAEFLTIAVARTSWHMYLASSFSAFKGLSAPLIRSHITKALPVEDIAKVFALLCAMEALCPLLSPVLYNTLYEATISTFPGAVFVLSAAIFTGCCLMIGMAQYYYFKSFSPSYQRVQVES